MNLNKIPATVVTGFLGSGKTTLLSNVLKQANGKKIAVIVNEFGELDIDANLLKSCPLPCEDDSNNSEKLSNPVAEDGIYELANGCICCTVEEEFLPVMKQLVERRDNIDHILIETSGLALPKPLVQAFNWPGIKEHCTVDAVITVVDGPALLDGRFAHKPELVEEQRQADESLDHDPSLKELYQDQLSVADLVIVSKTDQLEEEQHTNLNQMIRHDIPTSVKTLFVDNGKIDVQLITGLEAESEARINDLHTHHDHHHHHDEEHHHAHEEFDSFLVETDEMDENIILANLSELVKMHNIFRVKGFLAIPNKPMRKVVQVVGNRVDHYFDRLWEKDEKPKTQLVFIGKNISEALIREGLFTA